MSAEVYEYGATGISGRLTTGLPLIGQQPNERMILGSLQIRCVPVI
jgi:hypothetical protein